jgi:hypothetical protein
MMSGPSVLILSFTMYTHALLNAQAGDIGALSNATGGMTSDVFSVANNGALMTDIKKAVTGFSCTNFYGLKDLNRLHIAMIIPYQQTAYGSNFNLYGNGVMSSMTAGLAFAHKPHPMLSFGITGNYRHLSIVSYGHKTMLTADVSILMLMTKKLGMSFSVFNIMGNKPIPLFAEPSGRTFRISLKLKISEQVHITSDVEKSGAFKTNLRMACLYKVHDDVHFSVGFSSLQSRCIAGFIYQRSKYTFHCVTSISRLPGISQTLSVIYALRT